MRHLLFLDLVDDAEKIATYRNWHRPGGPPASVTRAIRDSGIVSMQIWQVGDRMAMVMETSPDFDPAATAKRDANDPDIRAWEALMDAFQRRMPFAPPSVKWVAAECIYDLDDQP